MALKIVVDSSSSFSQEDAKRLNITILPLKIIFGEKIDSDKEKRLLYLHKVSEHKRNLAVRPISFKDFNK